MSYDIDEFGNKTFNEVEYDLDDAIEFDEWLELNYDLMTTQFIKYNPELQLKDDDLADLGNRYDFQEWCENAYQDWCADTKVRPSW